MDSFFRDVEECIKILKTGGLILYPTDTIWGIGCDATNEKAVEKIYGVKKRSDKKTMIVLVGQEYDVLKYTKAPDKKLFNYLQQINRPTTVIYDNAIGLARNLIAENGSIAIRICKEPFCNQLLKDFAKPIVSTSANISGQPAAMIYSEINDEIKKKIDYIVKYRQNDVRKALPSALIRWENGQPVIIRP